MAKTAGERFMVVAYASKLAVDGVYLDRRGVHQDYDVLCQSTGGESGRSVTGCLFKFRAVLVTPGDHATDD